MLQGNLYNVLPDLDGTWDVEKFLNELEIWLKQERLIEISTGKPLCQAKLVIVDGKKVSRTLQPMFPIKLPKQA